jgi:hypothetical protein
VSTELVFPTRIPELGTVWTITPDGTQYAPTSVSVTLSGNGTATAPDSWALYGPDGSVQTSRITGSGHTVSFLPYYLFGPWRLVAVKDGAPVATHTTILSLVAGPGLVPTTPRVFGA